MTVRISPAYLAEQRWLHDQPQGYGGKGARWAGEVHRLAAREGCMSILDYGCGAGSLARELARRGLTIAEYDPAIMGKDADPEPADLVVCTDVLEHVEPEHLEAVLDHLADLAGLALFVSIGLKPAGKKLRDGRNAHINLRPADAWRADLSSRFRRLELARRADEDPKHFTAACLKE